jgi:DNA-binding transcriptional ArsR family regulator
MSTPEVAGPDLSRLGEVDKLIHEPGRLQIVSWLSVVEEADFLFLLERTGLTRGNLSSHIGRLENAGYVDVEKTFVGKIPRTVYRLTSAGKRAFQTYRRDLMGALESL